MVLEESNNTFFANVGNNLANRKLQNHEAPNPQNNLNMSHNKGKFDMFEE
jgi:hypothetical protein